MQIPRSTCEYQRYQQGLEQPMKLALALQVWSGDVWLAKRLMELIVSFEKVRHDFEFIVSARRGTNKDAVADIAKLAKSRFQNVHVIHGMRFGTGWPNGCNDLWQETMMRVSQMHSLAKIKSRGVLTFEADCLPLRPDWLDRLAEEWWEARSQGFKVMGHAHGEPCTHINGNAIFDPEITDLYPELNGCEARMGWDAYHGKLLVSIGKDTNLIYQRYRIPSITRKEVEDIRKNDVIPALFHGIKGTTGLEAVEAMVRDGTFQKRP